MKVFLFCVLNSTSHIIIVSMLIVKFYALMEGVSCVQRLQKDYSIFMRGAEQTAGKSRSCFLIVL